MIDTTNSFAPATVDGFRQFYQQPDLAIGISKRSSNDPGGPGPYTASIAGTYPNKGPGSAYPNAVSEYRRLLASRSSNDVTILCTGFLSLLNDLLNSPADTYSTLTGSQLLAAKCARVVVVAGYWPNSSSSAASAYGHTAGSAEYNLAQAAADASNFVTNCPVPVEFVGVEIGDNVGLFASTLASTRPAYDILRRVQTLWNSGNSIAAGTGRPGWGLLGLIYIVSPSKFTTTSGTAAVNASTGANTFTAGAGTHKYAAQVATSANLVSQGDGYVLDQLNADQ